MSFLKRILGRGNDAEAAAAAAPPAPPPQRERSADRADAQNDAPGGAPPRRRRRQRKKRPASRGAAAAQVVAPPRSGGASDRPERRPRSEQRGGERSRGQRRERGGRPPRPRSDGGAGMTATQKALLSGGYDLPDLATVDEVGEEAWPPAFRALDISERMLSVLAALRFEEPTPIQEQAIPPLLDGRDVVGQAQTGTGKTVAFGIPAIELCDPSMGEAQAIVLVPTRELAAQVGTVLEFFARAAGLEATVLMGGRRLKDDFANLERGPQIVVGTPGRIIDHLDRRTLNLSWVKLAVLDEADRMLDIGFEPDMRRILRRCPSERQTALFSATIPTPIKTLIWRYMQEPHEIHIAPETATAEGIAQRYYEVANRDKPRAVEELLPELDGRTLVFCNMKVTVDRLVDRLRRAGIDADAIHGDRDQSKRDRVMGSFRAGDLQFLVATDVAARGLDIPDVNHVVNYDLPQTAEDYVHRVGRTGRAGKSGSAVSFVGEWDFEQLEKILATVGEELQRAELELYRR